MGLNIDHLGRGPDVARQAEIFCDARELQAMAAMPMAKRVDRLVQILTLKEAFLKAKGVGMFMQLNHFGFDFFAAAGPHIQTSSHPGHGSPSDWYFASLSPTVGTVSIAVRRPSKPHTA